MKKKKEIHASFVVSPQTTKVTVTVRNRSSVKMEKTWNISLWVGDMSRKCFDGLQHGAPESTELTGRL